MKICPRCKEKKALDEFYKKKDRRAGSYCKPCQLAYVRDHYKRTSAAYNARRYALHGTYVDRNRRHVLEYLANHPCVDCAESDVLVLEFDHVSGTKISSISRLIRDGAALHRFQTEIEKCVIRCANCHRRKTAGERGSYRMTPWLYEIAEKAPSDLFNQG
jgi:hypothetical protein